MSSISTLLSGVFHGGNAATSRLSATLDQRAASASVGGNWRESIVDLATLIGMPTDVASRRQLATELDFFGDLDDTAMMNTFLHNRIVMTIVENHAVDVAARLDQRAAGRTFELDWRDSVVDLMKLFGLRSRLTRRERLATKLGFTGDLGPSGTMNLWLHTRLMLTIVDRGGTLPEDLAPRPERTSAERAGQLCRTLRTKDALVPALAAVWERRKSGKPGRNDFERRLYGIFDGLDAGEQEGLGRAFDGYSAFRRNEQGDCLFADELAEAVRADPPEKKDFAAAIIRQGLELTTKQDFPSAAGKPGPGQARPWRKGINFEGGAGPEAPWPWITKLHYGNDRYWFGNIESVLPAPPVQVHAWEGHQFEQTCSFQPLAAGGVEQKCQRVVLQPPQQGGGMQFPVTPVCVGGPNYTTIDNECLRIPARQAGDSIWLCGFNFIAPFVDVHLQSLGVTDRRTTIKDCPVFGDVTRPVRNEQGEAIVDMSVDDRVVVPLPTQFPTGSGASFPPGLYEVSISVSDPSAPPGAPIVRESNRLVLRIEPDPQTQFQLDCEGGRCIRETPGGGDDEIWWDAFVGHLVPNQMPIGRDTPSRAETVRVSVNRAAWEDVDDGQEVTSASTIFGPRSFEVGGVLFVSVVGFEVDSEAAARENLQGFWSAFGKALEELAKSSIGTLEDETGFTFSGMAEDFAGGGGATSAASLLTTGHYMMATMAAAIVLSSAALWAAWAPADMIALDMFMLNARESWDRTDAAKILPPDRVRQFRSDNDDTDVLVTVNERPLPKSEPVGEVATWRHEIQYDAKHDGDAFSSYLLRFRLTRRAVV